MDKTELETNYIETIYSVFINDDKVDCKIGELAPAVINQLIEKDHSAVVLTAWNPKSELLAVKENKKRNHELLLTLQQQYTVLKALGQGRTLSWSAEESFFVIGLSKEKAEKIAVDYEQHAYVWIEIDKPVSLEFSRIWKECL